MLEHEKPAFNVETYLASAGLVRIIVKPCERLTFFSQGTPADYVFYLQIGRAKLNVVATNGKEAAITLLTAREFVGEDPLAIFGAPHVVTATTTVDCTFPMKIPKRQLPTFYRDNPSRPDLPFQRTD